MKPLTSILVDIDTTAAAHPELDRAADLARVTGARLRIVDSGAADEEFHPDLRTRHLALIAGRLDAVRVDAEVLEGPSAQALITDALRFRHDLIVRSHARDLVARDGLSIPVSVQLVRQSPCPVWLVGAGPAPEHAKIVCAVDAGVDDPSREHLNARLIDLAFVVAAARRGVVTLLQAWRPFSERLVHSIATGTEFSRYLDRARREARRGLSRVAGSYRSNISGVRLDLRRGDLEDVLPEMVVAEGIDVVVIGTTARSALARRFLGNAAERLLRKLPCSVLVVKPEGRTSS